MSEYLHIRGWKRFQHYKDRSPPWIKLHREIFTSEDWVMLADASKLLMVVCMVVGARFDGRVPNNPEYLKRMAFLDKLPNLTPLIDCGFLQKPQADASDMQADAHKCPSESYREEKERKKERLLPARPHSSNPPCFKHSANSKNLVEVNKADNVDKTHPAIKTPALKSATYEKAHDAAPGYDIYFIEEKWISSGFAARAKNPDTAFLGFVRKHVKGNPL